MAANFGILMDFISILRSHLPCYSIKPPQSFLDGSKLLCKLCKYNFLSSCACLCINQTTLYAILFPVVAFAIIICPSRLIAHSVFLLRLFCLVNYTKYTFDTSSMMFLMMSSPLIGSIYDLSDNNHQIS